MIFIGKQLAHLYAENGDHTDSVIQRAAKTSTENSQEVESNMNSSV
jgi:hypothetical protein